MIKDQEAFAMALKAFGLFTPEECELTLIKFASLRYPLIEDRFFEAVHWTIATKPNANDKSLDGRRSPTT